MAIALHPYLMGVPHRIGALDAALKYICKHKKVWKATGSEIAGHYLAQFNAGGTKKAPARGSTEGRSTMTLFRIFFAALWLGAALLQPPAARAADSVSIGTVGSASANLWPVISA